MIKISIIVAAYNIDQYIEKCLDSLVNQSYSNLEIIIVNDGSIDNTLNIIEKYEKKDKRIKKINKKNAGLIAARKTGIENSFGDYIIFVDGDDWLDIDCCKVLVENISINKSDIIYYNLDMVYDDGTFKKNKGYDNCVVEEYSFLELVLKNKVRANIVLQCIKREFFIKNIEIPNNITYGEDLLLTILIAMNKPKVSFINKSLYYYYQRNNSVTNSVNSSILDIHEVFDKIEILFKKEKIFTYYRKEFEFLSFLHLFYYRLIDVNNINKYSKINFNFWKNKNIKFSKNIYCKSFIKSLSINYKIKIFMYQKYFILGYIYSKLQKHCYQNIKLLIKNR